jgi:uncharacterized membrane protein SpoIIM required for sporulation
MKNKQRGYLKIVAAITMLLIISTIPAYSQSTSFRLKTADSLFQQKRYTQSFEHYEEMLKQKQYTPSMLLKMAFIKEGLLQIGQSMYYLNLYFLATHDRTALGKMNELATKFHLEGYETSETDQFLLFYHDHNLYISAALFALMVFMVSLMIYTRTRLKRRPVVSFTFLVVVILVSGAHVYYGSKTESGIFTQPSTYIMSGPSAAASVIEIVGDGHRVDVIGKKDVWIKIKWDNQVAYVRENTLLPIKL